MSVGQAPCEQYTFFIIFQTLLPVPEKCKLACECMRCVPCYIFGAPFIPYHIPFQISLVSQFFLGERGTPRRFHDFHRNVDTVCIELFGNQMRIH